ncbi:hypothetical protein MHK03_05995 [Corynebacterium simulans]|uniref:hypothetical protein n=1 Tax=Corynebacterium simulans TaxID=146827 RepID=UPI001EF2117D|nr:hypothetical protein [Corynebacterium simulans]MCG7247476.1 hypothetical protein [Corynebacterium simulans]
MHLPKITISPNPLHAPVGAPFLASVCGSLPQLVVRSHSDIDLEAWWFLNGTRWLRTDDCDVEIIAPLKRTKSPKSPTERHTMPNPTRQEIIEAQLARQWAEQVQQTDAEYERKGRRYSGDPMRAAAAYILSHTPAPTMAEVEWDDDKHYLAEAETNGVKVVMLAQHGDVIRCIQPPNAGGIVVGLPRQELTPTGRRYTLTEEINP